MSRSRATAAALLASLALSACGSNSNPADGPESRHMGDFQAHRPLPAGLRASVEGQAEGFLEREGTALRESLHRFLGPRLTTAVERGSAICRPGSETPSIDDPSKYPFACVVRASADGEGLEVEISLGFVGTELDGDCWRAANERVAVTTTMPALLTREEAERQVNQIDGCA